MQVKSIAECFKASILQYFRPSLSYHLSLRSLFCVFLSGHFTQVLLYGSMANELKEAQHCSPQSNPKIRSRCGVVDKPLAL